MIPVIAIVGRPNVGKSTLFNRLTKTKDALVVDMPGVTRDRKYGDAKFDNHHFILIDTGGIAENQVDIDDYTTKQAQLAVEESDAILFIVDAKAGVTPADKEIAQYLRKTGKQVFLVANKTDGMDINTALSDLYQIGMDNPHPISAAHGKGVKKLLDTMFEALPSSGAEDYSETHKGIRIAIIGKPNVGKSTLTNRLLGEERVISFDEPGTTRDSIFIPLEKHGKHYTIIDTAGIRRRKNVTEVVEKFSIIKSLKAIEAANVVIFLIDARENLSDQDLKLLSFVVDSGRGLIVGINKWDNLGPDQREAVKSELDRRLHFLDFARKHFISALHGTGVGDLFDFAEEAYESATRELSTPDLTRLLENALQQHQPPLVNGRRIKLRYAHTGGHNPPIIVIHGNQVDKIPDSYKRYLNNFYQKALKLIGTPIRIQYKGGNNPYKNIKNKLTLSQERSRKRMIKHSRGKKNK